MNWKAQREDIQVRQAALNFIKRSTMRDEVHSPFVAQVIQVYSDRMTCDIKAIGGNTIKNVTILAKGGLVNGKVYGEMCLPAKDDYVIVGFGSYGQRHKMILGTILPYLLNEFIKDGVNSGSKQFTKKLFEANKPLEYRRIFKSGTTVQIEEDGGIILETPSGTYIKISETDSKLLVEDQHGNIIILDSTGVNLTDTDGNEISMETGKVVINGNLEVLQ